MNAPSQFPPLKLHRGFVRPLPVEHMAHHDPEAVYDPEVRKAFDKLERFCRERPDLHPRRHERIDSAFTLSGFIEASAIAVAVLTVAYFVATIAVRGWVL